MGLALDLDTLEHDAQQIRAPEGPVYLRVWSKDADAIQVRDEAHAQERRLLTELGDDLADLASLQAAARAHGQTAALGAFYTALATVEGIRTMKGKHTAQLASIMHKAALEHAVKARAIAENERARRKLDIPADGRELFGAGAAEGARYGKAGR